MTNVCLSNGSSLPACSVQQKWLAIRWCHGKSLFTRLSCFLLLDDLSIHIPGNSIFTRCAPTAWCCFRFHSDAADAFFSSRYSCLLLFSLNRLERLFLVFLSCRSCFMLWSIYLHRHCGAAWATATIRMAVVGLLKERCVQYVTVQHAQTRFQTLDVCVFGPGALMENKIMLAAVRGQRRQRWGQQHIRSFWMLI